MGDEVLTHRQLDIIARAKEIISRADGLEPIPPDDAGVLLDAIAIREEQGLVERDLGPGETSLEGLDRFVRGE